MLESLESSASYVGCMYFTLRTNFSILVLQARMEQFLAKHCLNDFSRIVPQAPSTGREDRLVGRALKKLQFGVFGRGGEMAVRKALEAAGKSLGDKLNLLNMTWLLADTGESGLPQHGAPPFHRKFIG